MRLRAAAPLERGQLLSRFHLVVFSDPCRTSERTIGVVWQREIRYIDVVRARHAALIIARQVS